MFVVSCAIHGIPGQGRLEAVGRAKTKKGAKRDAAMLMDRRLEQLNFYSTEEPKNLKPKVHSQATRGLSGGSGAVSKALAKPLISPLLNRLDGLTLRSGDGPEKSDTLASLIRELTLKGMADDTDSGQSQAEHSLEHFDRLTKIAEAIDCYLVVRSLRSSQTDAGGQHCCLLHIYPRSSPRTSPLLTSWGCSEKRAQFRAAVNAAAKNALIIFPVLMKKIQA